MTYQWQQEKDYFSPSEIPGKIILSHHEGFKFYYQRTIVPKNGFRLSVILFDIVSGIVTLWSCPKGPFGNNSK